MPRLYIHLLFLLLPAIAVAAPERVVLPALHESAREHAAYFPKLLRLALDKTVATDGPYDVSHFDQQLTSPRQVLEVKNQGVINVMWDGTDAQRERDLLPVKISLLRELNDYRVFLIRKGDEQRFAKLSSLDELRRMSAGAGVNWPSTAILRANGLPVVTSIAYEYLFPMLAAKRFDYMPRGIYEAYYEQRSHAKLGLVIEKTIFFHYPVPFYFFVSRDNPRLAARIERGLRIALKDGSFDRLFNSYPAFRRSMEEIRNGRPKVFELKTR